MSLFSRANLPLPSTRLFALLAALLAFAVLIPFYPELASLWDVAVAVLLGVLLLDAIGIKAPAEIVAERHLPGSLPLGVWHQVSIKLHNHSNRTLDLRVFDHYPTQMTQQQLPAELAIHPDEWGEIHYRIRPERRGREQFGRCELRLLSRWGFWWRKQRVGESQEVRVYPNFAAVSNYALMATDNRLSQIGVRKRPRRGAGMDFHQLREFRDGDSPAQVDWKATARTRKLISREYQDERDQEIVFLLDCGKRMLSHDGELSHFDNALNAILLLGYVALRQGDAVGIATFSGSERWLPPAKGVTSVKRLLNGIFDLQPDQQSPDYSAAATQLLLRQRKRALVVVVSNLRDEDQDDLIPALKLLKQRHLVLFASLRELAVEQQSQQAVSGFDNALAVAATHDYMEHREQAITRLRQQHIDCLDVIPEQLPLALVNRYLDIKSRGAL